uniref:Uncharacterized protein n=2 Tax=Spironucleus salmonicida TaxID=348837 RepID=V6LG03_9EUKA|eukprot:EST42631.1 Hypothetical protein SS50377_17950 [Spironucleus salmonicida]
MRIRTISPTAQMPTLVQQLNPFKQFQYQQQKSKRNIETQSQSIRLPRQLPSSALIYQTKDIRPQSSSLILKNELNLIKDIEQQNIYKRNVLKIQQKKKEKSVQNYENLKQDQWDLQFVSLKLDLQQKYEGPLNQKLKRYVEINQKQLKYIEYYNKWTPI